MDGKLTTNENYIKAVNLNSKIIVSAQAAQQNLYDMCVAFKEMRDSKLYKELGYSDFGDYCEKETGFKRSQAYNYIAIAEKLPEDFVQPVGQIGMRKLLLLTKISEEERAEITAEADLESATVKELEQQIKQLRADKGKAVADKSAAEADSALKADTIASLESTKRSLNERIAALGKQISELESRPIEVATQTVEKVPKGYIAPQAYSDMVDKYEMRIDEMESEQLALRREAHAKQTELENQIAELEKQSGNDPEATFKLICGMLRNPLSQLMVFADQNRDYISETKKFLSGYLNALEDKK